MDYTTFVRKPFTVEAVQVTPENIAEIAEFVGELATREEDGTVYIKVNKKKIPNVFQVFVGYWVTKMGSNIRCYSPKVFAQQFTENTEDIDRWVKFIETQPTEAGV